MHVATIKLDSPDGEHTKNRTLRSWCEATNELLITTTCEMLASAHGGRLLQRVTPFRMQSQTPIMIIKLIVKLLSKCSCSVCECVQKNIASGASMRVRRRRRQRQRCMTAFYTYIPLHPQQSLRHAFQLALSCVVVDTHTRARASSTHAYRPRLWLRGARGECITHGTVSSCIF